MCVTWVFFRSPSLEATQDYLSTLLPGERWSTTMTPLVAAMLVLGALTQIIPSRWFDRLEAATTARRSPSRWRCRSSVIFLIAVAAPGGMPPFIYFQF